jgi:hypothetical protein
VTIDDETRTRAALFRRRGIHTIDDLLTTCVQAEHGREDDCYPDEARELSRWYFDRELRVGRRVVFAWRDWVRHPDWFTPAALVAANAQLVAGGAAPLTPEERDGHQVQIVGVEFVDIDAAVRVDLTALVRGRAATDRFTSWVAAVAWARSDHDR